MKKVKVLLNSFAKVGKFHHRIETMPGDFDLCQGRYTVNAKSILGIYSLDLSKPAYLVFSSPDQEQQLLGSLKEFIVSEEAGTAGDTGEDEPSVTE